MLTKSFSERVSSSVKTTCLAISLRTPVMEPDVSIRMKRSLGLAAACRYHGRSRQSNISGFISSCSHWVATPRVDTPAAPTRAATKKNRGRRRQSQYDDTGMQSFFSLGSRSTSASCPYPGFAADLGQPGATGTSSQSILAGKAADTAL